MPFFKNAGTVEVSDGKFNDVAGNVNAVDYSQHTYHEGSHVTTTTKTEASYNGVSSTGMLTVNRPCRNQNILFAQQRGMHRPVEVVSNL
jgi:hypothetical protein